MSILSKREVELAALLHSGHSYHECAQRLGVTADTARKMTREIAAKLGPTLRHPAGPRETVLRWLDILNTRS